MRKIMNEIKKNIAFRQINDALNIRNESFIDSVHALSLNSFILMYRESNANQSKTWKEFFKFFNIQNESIIIELFNGFTKFKIISIKSYFNDGIFDSTDEIQLQSNENSIFEQFDPSIILEQVMPERINSIESNTFSTTIISIKRDRDRLRKHSINVNFCFLLKNIDDSIDTIYFFFRR